MLKSITKLKRMCWASIVAALLAVAVTSNTLGECPNDAPHRELCNATISLCYNATSCVGAAGGQIEIGDFGCYAKGEATNQQCVTGSAVEDVAPCYKTGTCKWDPNFRNPNGTSGRCVLDFSKTVTVFSAPIKKQVSC